MRHHAAAEPGKPASQLRVGRLSLDLVHYEAVFDGKELELTPCGASLPHAVCEP